MSTQIEAQPAAPAFSKEIPHLQLAWDSTSLDLLKTCPHKYFQTIIEGRRPRAFSPSLTFGGLLHKGLERYDHARILQGLNHEQAQEYALWQTLHEAGTVEQRCPYCGSSEITPEPESGHVVCRACEMRFGDAEIDKRWRPLFTPEHKPRTVATLARTIVWYTEHFKDDPAKTVILSNGRPAVELSFRYPIGMTAPTGEDYLLCGHLDRLVDFAGDRYVQDRKTTARTIDQAFFKKFNPDNQMSNYSLASKIVFGLPARGVMIDGIQVAVGFTRFQRGFTHRSPAQLEEWLAETKAWIKLAESMALSQFWFRNDTSCHHYAKSDGTGGCPFRELCSRDPSVRPNFEKTEYKIERWNPLETR